MNLLLDTHALIWWFLGNGALSEPARQAIADDANKVAVSAASAMEITTKYHAGKLPQADMIVRNFETMLAAEGFVALAITVGQAHRAGLLPIAHKDPFDRLLIAQAQIEDMVLVSNERLFDAAGVQRLW